MKKRNKIIYWIFTIWLALGMTSTGIVQVFKIKTTRPGSIDDIAHLGYPAYMLTLLGIWKLLGVVALLIPKFPLLKEWAYAGIFFTVTGALYSHIVSADSIKQMLPALLYIILIALSWYFRPADRKVILAN
jgi:uncharacterized membrane protein YphA (DoxX/SURF4 family)